MNTAVDLYLNDLQASGSEPMSREMEREMFARIEAGDEDARQQVATANLRYVVSVARKYEHQGMPLGDVIGHGNDGLMIAIDRFEVHRGYKFITYATSIKLALGHLGVLA